MAFSFVGFSLAMSVNAKDENELDPQLAAAIDNNDKSVINQITDEDLKRIAEEAILLERFGLSPELIKKAQELQKSEEDALYENEPARMVKEIISVSTDPSSESPVIYLTPGHDTLVSVLDSTGEPWPLVLVSTGNKGLVTSSIIESHKLKNIFRLKAERRVGSTNLTLLLADKSTSLTIKVVNTKKKYHPQPILQISDNGPLAKKNFRLSSNVSIRNDKLMKKLFFNQAPDGFQKLKTNNSDVVAWLSSDDSVFVKTKLTPTFPQAKSFYAGPNKYMIYEMQFLPFITLTNDNGIEFQVSLDKQG